MTSEKINLRYAALATLIIVAAFSRLIPHMPNFSPLGAIALFGAAYFRKTWQIILIPLAATWLSDLFINNVIYGQYYPNFVWISGGFYWQYGAYILIALVAILLFKKVNTTRIIGGALVSSTIFFLVSNFGVWAGGSMYAKTFSGLITCYAAGIPFIKGSILGDLVYAGLLFGSFYFIQKRISNPHLATVNAKN